MYEEAVQGVQRVELSSQAKPELLASLREIARSDGRHFHAVLEDAMSYFEAKVQHRVRPEVMAYYRTGRAWSEIGFCTKLLAR